MGATHGNFSDQTVMFTNTDYLVSSDYAAFAGYLRGPAIYKCPADKSTYGGQPKIRSYALNAFMNWEFPASGGEFSLSTTHVNFHKVGEIARANPSQMLAFVDVAPNWVCHSAFGIAMVGMYYAFPSTEHDQGGGLSFADGHVEWHHWRDAYTLQMAHADFVTHLNFAFTTYPDLVWLREHATVPK